MFSGGPSDLTIANLWYYIFATDLHGDVDTPYLPIQCASGCKDLGISTNLSCIVIGKLNIFIYILYVIQDSGFNILNCFHQLGLTHQSFINSYSLSMQLKLNYLFLSKYSTLELFIIT